jgi:transitional endoplasmic reticulum ATPase
MTNGYVGADLAELCREAGMCAYREDHSADCVTMKHFEMALKIVQASVTENELARYESLKKEMNRRKANHGNVSLYG